MKIRWTSDSIRFRITPTELDLLLLGGEIGETLRFPGGGIWSAGILAGLSVPSYAESADSRMMLHLNDADRDRLAATDVEGIALALPSDERGSVSLRCLIEKDFPCVHPRSLHAGEPETETFPPPAGFVARKEANNT